MSRVVPPLLFLSGLFSAAKADGGDCTLNCPLDAPCTMEAADFTAHTAIGLTSDGNMHCACPPGWTGLLCDHKFESCNDDHQCYHGGTCVPGLTDHYGNDQLFCDCSNAIASDGTHYVGKYCETPFDQFCHHDSGQNLDNELFCVNGGECNPNYNTDGIPCSCPTGWEGFHCEFKTGTVPDCDLECTNGGLCVVGVRDPEEAEHFNHVWSDLDISAHKRCVCPPGYGGPLCEVPAEACGDSDYCYNGGSCVTTIITTGGVRTEDNHCDCTTASDSDGNLFSGQFCQYVSTDICSETDENLFCVNGGRCNEGDPTQGCNCPPGFDGFKCDIELLSGSNGSGSSGNGNSNSGLCGDVYCLNGGVCIEEQFSLENGDHGTRDICDCDTATDAEGDLFAGESCQYKATDICIFPNGVAFCVNGGTCPSNPNDGCDCRDGWTGDSCEIHTLEEKDPEDPTCGPVGNVCLNGGECVETQVIKPDNTVETEYHCDCSQAFDEKHLYAGVSCQHPSTHLCTHPDSGGSLEGHLFCTNHGTCNVNVLRGCDCPEGFVGFSCEYEVLDADPNDGTNGNAGEPDIDRCGDLICHNGGTCLSTMISTLDGGTRNIDHCDCSTTANDETIFAGPECQYEATSFCTLPANGAGLETSLFCVNGGTCRDNVLQGCDCPTGWAGMSCEFPEDSDDLLDGNGDLDTVVQCGDIFCYNGGTCDVNQIIVDGIVTEEHTCDCSAAFDDEHLFAGPTCQFESTSLCTDLDEGESLIGKPFCVNHGQCGPNGCECPPGWSGLRCEIEVENDDHSEHGEPCGDGYCYHGGNCVTTRVSRPDGSVSEENHCDCVSAISSTDLYAGESCEHKSTAFCSHPQVEGSLEGVLFCVNGGTCADNPLRGCDCPPQWSGFSCQFETEPEDIADSLDDTGDGLEDCGEVGVCLNGGECVTTVVVNGDGERRESQHCDCSQAYNDVDIYAGPQCEFKSTAFCTVPEPGEDLGGIVFCVNGGACKDNVNQGCDCPPAWTGLRCEFQVDEDDLRDDDVTFVDDFVACGDDHCYHGGTCQKTFISGVEVESCDCSTAVTATDLYDGEFCQYKSTQFCSEPNGDSLAGIEFCTNGGQCTGNGCHCPSGYTGSRCEYPLYENQDSEDNIAPDNGRYDDDDNDYEECHLQCQNGGTCAKGAKDLGNWHDTVEHVGHLNQTYSSKYFEHCVCPEGWVGVECEHKAEICGDNEHICLHGSTCVKNNQQHGCDCSVADEEIDEDGHPLFAGDSCQHPATDICMTTEDFPGRPMYFCVNQGTCRAYVTPDDDFPGCDCPEDWTGPHCEVHVQSLAQNSASIVTTTATIFLYVFIAVVGIAVVIVGSSYCARRRSSQDQSRTCMYFRTRRQHSSRRFVVDPKEQSANLAPKRHDASDPPAVFNSNSDPITAGLSLPPDDEPEPYQDEPMEPYRDEPVLVNIGPPRDEDGHELHNVDFDTSESNDADLI